jgi:hypothetical protein
MYIFKELETVSVVALSDVELGNNQWHTLLQISLVFLQNQVTNLEQGSFRCSLFRTFLKMRVYSRIARLFFKIWSLK